MKLYVESICSALDSCLSANSSVVLLGEDILDPYGGAFKATKGLSTKHPDKVIATPISEGGIVGVATGMAMRGLLPVVEIMFGDFITLCCDQIINSATKFPLMYEGKVNVPLIIRTPVGGRRGYGPTHSQSLEKLFFGVPGIKVIAPNILSQPGELLKTAVLDDVSPILFLEDKGDYGQQIFPSNFKEVKVSKLDPTAKYPTMIAKNFDSDKKTDIFVVAYGGAASMALHVLEEVALDELRVELIAPSFINSKKMLEEISSFISKDTPIVIVEQGTEGFNWSSELMAIILEQNSNSRLVKRIAAGCTVIPAAKKLESEVIVTPARIKNAIFETLS